ncbi:MAG TPA: 1,4-dihydroxy-2-naphthoate polyprenyltransferase [Thermomicrobiales bacterium]
MTAATISPARAWMLAARPRTLPAALAPVIVGTALALRDGVFAPGPAIAAVVVALLLQIGANFANDVFDFRRGADTAERLGPTRVTQSGLIAERQVLAATIAVIVLAACAGMYLVLRGGLPILILGIAAIIATLAYTGGPFPLGYNGLGEVFVLIFFGFVAVAGTYYVQSLHLTATAIASAVPVGALVTNILVVNNLRDLETDRKAGKRTLAVRFGRAGTQREYLILMTVAYLTPALLWLTGALGPWTLLTWLTLPLAARLVRQTRQETGRALNKTLGGTAQLELLFSVLFAVGILLSRR